MWRFPRVSNRHGSAVCTHQCTQPTANLSMEKLEYVVVTLRVVTVSQGSVTLSTRNRRSGQLNYVVQTCCGICAACGVSSINSPVSHTHHSRRTMLAHSVAAGAHAASVSSRKPLSVRSQAVAETATTNGSSTATAPPPRPKAS